MVDSFKHKGLRNKLVEELSNKGIKDVKVLDAISKVPRHLFMDSSFIDHAYQSAMQASKLCKINSDYPAHHIASRSALIW